MDKYALDYDEEWDVHFKDFDSTVQLQVMNKIQQLKTPRQHRHLKHGKPYFVEESGGYRIVFKVNENAKTKTIRFVGTHKQYEKWYSGI